MHTASPAVPRRLKDAQAQIINLQPDDHKIRYSTNTWLRRFADDPDFAAVAHAHPSPISRKAVSQLITEDTDDTALRRLFIAAMLWGYGTTGYGAYRTRVMLDSPAHTTVLCDVRDHLRAGHLGATYTLLIKRTHMCGPAFGTKFLYFLGWGMRIEPRPLILDSLVAQALRSMGADGDIDLQRYKYNGPRKLHSESGSFRTYHD
jgi:hypothetical protein